MFYVFLCKLQLKLKTTLIIRIKVKSRFVILIAIIKSIFPFCFCPGYCRKTHPLGLSSQVKDIPDNSITASSQLLTKFHPSNARLRKLDYWCAKKRPNEKLSVDLGKFVSISGVATQGSRPGKTTEYRIRYSYDGRIWYGYPNNASLVPVRFGMLTIFYLFLFQLSNKQVKSIFFLTRVLIV
jgi:hypothetical protein